MKRNLLVTCAGLLVWLIVGGCASFDLYVTKPAIREEFDKSVKDYNRLLRWQEMENAGVLYLKPELRDAFFESVASIRKRGVTITEYRVLSTDYNAEKETAEVRVEFDYFALPSSSVKKVVYKQDWIYTAFSGDTKVWKLTSGLPEFK